MVRAHPTLGRDSWTGGVHYVLHASNVSYEEYHPYGTTAWWTDPGSTVSQKRYRYTGKEKDEESGLYYHGARYYIPWLARWCSSDPSGLADGANRYVYCHNGPSNGKDPDGRADVRGIPTENPWIWGVGYGEPMPPQFRTTETLPEPQVAPAPEGQVLIKVSSYAPFKWFGGGPGNLLAMQGNARDASPELNPETGQKTGVAKYYPMLPGDGGSATSLLDLPITTVSRTGTTWLPWSLTTDRAVTTANAEGELQAPSQTTLSSDGREKGAYSSPLPLVTFAPPIDVEYELAVDNSGMTESGGILHVEGTFYGDQFPNLEVVLFGPEQESGVIIHAFGTWGSAGTGPMTFLPAGNEGSMGRVSVDVYFDATGQPLAIRGVSENAWTAISEDQFVPIEQWNAAQASRGAN